MIAQYIKLALFFLFFLSGFAGLIYESIWSHYIELILGHAAYAQSLVLGIFMGGMAIGAWLVSRVSSRIKRPLLWYAVVEGIIGIMGLIFHNEFVLLQQLLFTRALPVTSNSLMAFVIKWGISSFMLLPQAVLLGATFPLMSAGIIRYDQENSGYTLGMLYFTNSIGAAIGVLFSGFFLIENVGLPGTILTAGMINIVVSSCVWLLTKDLSFSQPTEFPGRPRRLITAEVLLLGIAMVTGASSFFYEIGWIRMLSLVLGSSVQAFELMLSAFITGLAFGSYYIRRRADKLENPGIYLAGVQIIMGFLAIATLPMYMHSFTFMAFLIKGLSRSDAGYVLFNVCSHCIALGIMIPATFMAGMTLPLLTNTLLRSGGKESVIGRIYAANTCGAIIGILLAVNFVLPALGVKGLIISGGIADIALGLVLMASFAPICFRQPRYMIPLGVVFLGVLAFSFTPFNQAVMSSGVYRFGLSRLSTGSYPIYYRDGKTSTIALIRYPNKEIGIRTNGKTDALIAPLDRPYSADEITMVMAALVPLTLQPNAQTVANIGLGSGLTTHTLLASDTIKFVDTIEIERCMVEGARGFGARVQRTFDDPRSHIYIDDAKSFFSTHQKSYDIIVSEPSNPWVSGVGSLFSVEFYQHIRTYLNKDGIFVQWLQLYEIDLSDIASVIKALDKSFADFHVYNTDNANILIVATNGSSLHAMNPWIFADARLKQELRRVGIEHMDDLMIRYLGDKKRITPFFRSLPSPINSDFFPYLTYHAPRSRFRQDTAVDLSWLHIADVPVLNWLNGINPSEAISPRGRFFEFYARRAQAELVVKKTAQGIDDEKLRYAVELVGSISNPESFFGEDTLTDALLTIAASINPYLSSQRLEAFWSDMAERYGERNTGGRVMPWLQLHYAISQRNAEQTRQYARQILASQVNLNDRELHYLELALLTANVSQGNDVEARRVARFFQSIKSTAGHSFPIDFLIAMDLGEAPNP